MVAFNSNSHSCDPNLCDDQLCCVSQAFPYHTCQASFSCGPPRTKLQGLKVHCPFHSNGQFSLLFPLLCHDASLSFHKPKGFHLEDGKCINQTAVLLMSVVTPEQRDQDGRETIGFGGVCQHFSSIEMCMWHNRNKLQVTEPLQHSETGPSPFRAEHHLKVPLRATA